jgi:prevent-host-death family protein
MLVNVHEAKTHFSRLLARVADGEEIIIANAGRPVARLVAYRESLTPRSPGAWKGRVRMAPDFDELPFEVVAAFRGEPS